MQWFTRAWVNAELSDDEIDRRRVAYLEHHRRIVPTLDEQVAALAATDLHDGLVFAWSFDLDRGEIMLRILTGDLQRGYQFVNLVFRAATLVGLSPAELEALLPDCEILHEEIDRKDTGYEYRLILDPEGEFAIRFEDVTVSTEPATPEDRIAWFTSRSGEADWFSVRCIFHCGDTWPTTYEERITLWRARSLEEAIAFAEAEAMEYAETLDFRYLGLAQAYRLADEVGHGAEVFSLTRDSDLDPESYLDTFFDTGSERQGHIDEPSDEEPVQQRSTATDRTEPDHEGPRQPA